MDFADSKCSFNYEQLREALAVSARPVDLPQREPEAPSIVESMTQAAEPIAAAAAAPSAATAAASPAQASTSQIR